ncbi:MAG: tRNA (adenosine(37)-N6)-threonylcarbamoyltransferase complex ATPase subunit type 1 TsaE [Chitinophagaceae bacterium]|nr:tRNA (adenosine(37)-N6)-threonylcarbamoyltransferase complex ATPase subunit type 1 TsaE [Chitinophagaceae bacterium]
MEIIFSLNEIDEVAKQILEQLNEHKIIALYAEMGSGKTTLIKAICQQLGVKDTVNSPTFSIINEYIIDKNKKVIHMDWYRLKDELEAVETGVQDYLENNNNYCFIEWPEKAENLLPENVVKISISKNEHHENKRLLKII